MKRGRKKNTQRTEALSLRVTADTKRWLRKVAGGPRSIGALLDRAATIDNK